MIGFNVVLWIIIFILRFCCASCVQILIVLNDHEDQLKATSDNTVVQDQQLVQTLHEEIHEAF